MLLPDMAVNIPARQEERGSLSRVHFGGMGPSSLFLSDRPWLCVQVSVAAGRVSFMLGLQGPSMGVDTACSASLVATHLGRSALLTGQVEAAVAAGVHVQCSPTSTHYLWAASMLSPVGRCQTLDGSADGYVRGEACHSLVLTVVHPSNLQHEDVGHLGDQEGSLSGTAVILDGSAVNQDGRSSSLTAPNGPAQQNVIQEAFQVRRAPRSSFLVLFAAFEPQAQFGIVNPLSARLASVCIGTMSVLSTSTFALSTEQTKYFERFEMLQ